MFYLQRLQKYDFGRGITEISRNKKSSVFAVFTHILIRGVVGCVEGLLEAERHFGSFGESRPCCSSLETLVLHFGRAQV